MKRLWESLGGLGRHVGVLAAVVAALLVGFWARGCLAPELALHPSPLAAGASEEQEEKAELWICPMNISYHPYYSSSKAGNCKFCGMTLVQAEAEEEGGERRFKTTPAARALMEVQTEEVQRRFVTAEVRMVGKVEYDETAVRDITAWVGGRLDRLYVDYTGVQVNEGDHMVYLYSPELLNSQEALLQALKALKEDRPGELDVLKEVAEGTLKSARDRLLLMGLSEEQVAEIERRGEPTDHLTINAPAGGTVITKHAQEGMYVETGSRIYTIADLSRVWVKLDAYESDLQWLRYGQHVTFSAEAYPGETFDGIVALIHPVLEDRTRTVKVRVNVPNPDGKLKPGMFVRGIVRAQVAAAGKVMAPDLAGKWICPMHPEIVKDARGQCDVCGMPLVSAESLGYMVADETEAPLVIPDTAPLITGKRAVVYVELPGKDQLTFEGREVDLGPRAGDYYIVHSGLEEGEAVVTHGAFKIDSELQIRAKRSMMSPEGGVPGGAGHHHGGTTAVEPPRPHAAGTPEPGPEPVEAPAAFREQLGAVLEAYKPLQEALAGDNDGDAAEAAWRVQKAHDAVDMNLLAGDAHMAWMGDSAALKQALQQVLEAKDITGRREGFGAVSESLTGMLKRFGPVRDAPVYLLRCPMAFDGEGGTWLQDDQQTRNPYFGAAMPECGTVVETLSGYASEPTEGAEDE